VGGEDAALRRRVAFPKLGVVFNRNGHAFRATLGVMKPASADGVLKGRLKRQKRAVTGDGDERTAQSHNPGPLVAQ